VGYLRKKPTRTWLRQAIFSFRKFWSMSGSCFSDEKQKPMLFFESIAKAMKKIV
jgi:hypothetical protein